MQLKTRILFISYYFSPFPGVGAKRLTYWADNIEQYGYLPEVVTATKQKEESVYPVYYVKNSMRKRLFSKLIKDEGYSWMLDLIDFFSNFDLNKFKYVVISGGPFLHFEIANYIKRKNKDITVVYDYRDPFAINPRFNDNFIKLFIKKQIEKNLNRYADKIITVNEYCANLIQTKQKVEIIENGYDERILNKINAAQLTESKDENKEIKKLIHTGSLYSDRNPTTLLKVLSQQQEYEFCHYGNDAGLIQPFKQHSFFYYGGMIPYEEALQQIKSAFAGVIFTSGAPFESTTKVFDYIALNSRILIVTEGEKKTGNLHKITKNYPNVVWANNEEHDIKQALKKLSALPKLSYNPTQYSRKVSLENLVKILNEK